MSTDRARDSQNSRMQPLSAMAVRPVRPRLSLVERLECIAVLAAALVLVVMLLMLPSVVRADDHSAGGSGPYFGLQGGAARYFPDTDACGEVVEEINEAVEGESDARIGSAVSSLLAGSDCSVDDRGTAFRVFGGYRFSDWFAVEAALTSLGTAKAEFAGRTRVEGVLVDGDGSINLKVRGINLSAVFTAPIAPRFDVFGRVGVMAWDAEAKARASGTLSLAGQSLAIEEVTESASESGADLAYGVGLRAGITDQLRIRAELTRYEAVDIDVGWIGVEFRP